MIGGLGWVNLTCAKCRGSLTPLAAPNVYAVAHGQWCPRRCLTVCELEVLDDGRLWRRFRVARSTTEPRHKGCRKCDDRVRRAVGLAVQRRDVAAVHAFNAWGQS